jgi:hypothetical protein
VSVLPPGSVLVLTRDVCRFLAFAQAEILAKHRRAGIDSPALRAALAEIHAAAIGTPAHGGSASDSVPIIARSGVGGQSEVSGCWLSTRVAADRLKISQRRVVSLLQEGRIVGQQRGMNSAWRVSERSLEQYQTERPIRATSATREAS